MKTEKVITSIDIGTSKISVLICKILSQDNIQILGVGTSILKGVQKGHIKDKSLFFNALQNALKRAQVAADLVVENVIVNVPSGNNRFTIQSGIIQNDSDKLLNSKDRELALQKSVHCINKKDQSVLHLIPIDYRVDGQSTNQILNKKFNSMEVETAIILCDTKNLNLITSCLKDLELKVKGIISDYLSLGAILLPSKANQSYLVIDIGAQLTTISIYKSNKLVFAHTIQIGSEQITQDLSICLKCSFSEAERIKVLHGQLQKSQSELTKDVVIQCYDGQKKVKISLITSVIEARVNQLYQLIQKYTILAPPFDEVMLTGSGANLKGLLDWMSTKFPKPFNRQLDSKYKELNINSNYTVAMGQIIYASQIGLLRNKSSEFKSRVAKIFFKHIV